MAELKPCPFCGCKTINVYMCNWNDYNGKTRIKCGKCNAEMVYSTRKKAFEAWDKRFEFKA